ncbi:hypothetical protein [Vibrio gigantis]|uniref:hypothetical protein n=1 Tax=Vibrio gigantis TaxID=296199 RepID=UPI001E5603F4|nr:hypothetical protein [Vibrio gigantis]
MKAIVSLFVSAYQPGMASIECRPYSLNQSRHPLLCDNQYGDERSETGVYKDKGYKDKADEYKGYEGKHFEDQRFAEHDVENLTLKICSLKILTLKTLAMRIFVG